MKIRLDKYLLNCFQRIIFSDNNNKNISQVFNFERKNCLKIIKSDSISNNMRKSFLSNITKEI